MINGSGLSSGLGHFLIFNLVSIFPIGRSPRWSVEWGDIYAAICFIEDPSCLYVCLMCFL